MAQIIVINQTSNSLSYVNGQILVPANNSTSVSFGLAAYLVLDPNFRSDLISNKVFISDTVNIYKTTDALNYLNNFISNGPPQNSNDPVAFTLAGMGFSCTASASLSSSTETALLLLNNPSDATVNARAMYFYAAPSSTQGIVAISFYVNPTITNNGTSIPILNNLVSSSSPSSSMSAYALPTTSSFGTKRMTVIANSLADMPMFDFSQTAILTPGNSILMTVSISNLGLLGSATTYFYMQWVEA